MSEPVIVEASLTNLVLSPFQQSLIERLGWTFFHSVWQFALVGVLLGLCLRAMASRSAQSRYFASCSAMLCMLLLMAAAFWRLPLSVQDGTVDHDLSRANVSPSGSASLSIAGDGSFEAHGDPANSARNTPSRLPQDRTNNDGIAAGAATLPGWFSRIEMAVEPWLTTIVTLWLVGVAVLSVRPCVGWYAVHRLRRVGISAVPPATVELLHRAAKTLGIKRAIRIMQSVRVEVPVVVGYVRPLILLPASAVCGLSTEQLEAVIAHELAHVRRHDYLVNLAQTLVETLLFYHPVVWWVSRHIRIERENCCDDMALALCRDRATYAGALVAVDQLRSAAPSLALSAAGGSLLARIRRIVLQPSHNSNGSFWFAASVLGGIAAMVIAFGTNVSSQEVATAEPEPAPAPVATIGWGKPSNGLRCRIVPVRASMSEDEIDLDQETARFESPEGVAFAVELENVGKRPIELLDTRYGKSYGDSQGKAASDWFGQFLFSIDWFDGDGARIKRPDVQVVDLNMPLSGVMVATIEPGRTHRFLLRPTKWLSVMTQRLKAGEFQATVHYHGLSSRAAKRLREYRPDSGVLTAWSGDVVSPTAAFEIAARTNNRPVPLAWGDESDGLRAALDLVPNKTTHTHGEKPDVKLHVQNVSKKPITLASFLWLSDIQMTAKNDQGKEFTAGGILYTGWTLSGRITLLPQQTTIFDAGNLGIAASKEQADAFEHITNRKLIAPAGTYRLQLSGPFGTGGYVVKDGKGKQLSPLEGDWAGELTTGFAPLIIAAEKAADAKADANQAKQAAATPPLERLVSLTAEHMPRRDALAEVCRQAGVSLKLDMPAISVLETKGMNLDLDQQISLEINNRSLSHALGLLIGWHATAYAGFYYEIQRRDLLLSTGAARDERIRKHLPDWLRPLYRKGVTASLDADHNVAVIYLGSKATDDLLEKLKTLPKLRELHVGSTTAITPKGLAHLASLPALEKLELHSVNREGAGLGDAVLESIQGLKILRELALRECGTTDAGARLLEEMPQLTHLTLRQEGRLTDAALASVAKLKHLKNLNLISRVGTAHYGRMRFTDEGVRQLAALHELEELHLTGHAFPSEALDLRRLKSLSIGGKQADDEDAARIAQCKDLRSLSLMHTNITDVGLKQIAGMQKLRNLRLTSRIVTNAGTAHLAKLPQLEFLKLRASKIDDATLGHVAQIKTLTRLDLSGSRFFFTHGGPDIPLFGYAQLAKLPNLKTLSLYYADVPWTVLAQLRQLRELSLMMPTMSQDDVLELQKALPETFVTASSGGSAVVAPNRGIGY